MKVSAVMAIGLNHMQIAASLASVTDLIYKMWCNSSNNRQRHFENIIAFLD